MNTIEKQEDMRPLIVITNDDGIGAPGIMALQEALMELGDILVVSPDGPRSAQSNAITSVVPLRLHKVKEEEGLAVYKCSGTPTDCVKMALNLIADRRPSMVVSGINHGVNTSISVIYSGTMGAALEGCVDNVASFGISIDDYSRDADMTHAAEYARKVAEWVLKNGLPRYTCLNVNVPKGKPKGVKWCRQAQGSWKEEFERRVDPYGHNYYWLGGEFVNHEPGAPGTDQEAVESGMVSIVPVRLDMTDFGFLEKMEKEFKF